MPARRRQDVASRAVDALTRWAFDDVGFHRLELTHAVHNLPSCRVATKTGFDFEGVKRRAGLHLDGWHDMHLHARINDTKLGMGNSVTEIHATTIDHSPAVTRLLALAIGDDPHCLQHVVRRYRDDPAAGLLVAVVDHDTAGVIGYSVGDSAVTLLHIATAPHVRNTGVGTQLVDAMRRAVPAGLPIVAETDQDAVGFYAANNFAVTSLGEKYPGVERFRVQLRAPTNPKPDP